MASGSLRFAINVSVVCAFDRTALVGVGVGVENVTRPVERLLTGVAVADGMGVSSPATGVRPGDATTRWARGLWWWLHDAATKASASAAITKRRACTRL